MTCTNSIQWKLKNWIWKTHVTTLEEISHVLLVDEGEQEAESDHASLCKTNWMYCTIIITVTQLLVDYLCNSSHLRELFIPPYFHPYPTRITQDRAHEYPRQEVHFEAKMVCCFAATIMLSLAEFTLEDEQIVSTDKSSDNLFVYI